ncbi:MAG TPA: FeoA family protein, partial [Steroidobacteraceae bacterium]|nr:FeoA family protein [Steroidobacteraceae bacterium]
MDAAATPAGLTLDPGFVSLAALPPGTAGRVVGVGARAGILSPLERRLLEFGFVDGEQVEILAEARPGRDPFVVRVGHTTLALRRREAESIWVELHRPGTGTSPQAQVDSAGERVELQRPGSSASPQTQVASASERVELHRPGTGTARTP